MKYVVYIRENDIYPKLKIWWNIRIAWFDYLSSDRHRFLLMPRQHLPRGFLWVRMAMRAKIEQRSNRTIWNCVAETCLPWSSFTFLSVCVMNVCMKPIWKRICLCLPMLFRDKSFCEIMMIFPTLHPKNYAHVSRVVIFCCEIKRVKFIWVYCTGTGPHWLAQCYDCPSDWGNCSIGPLPINEP